MKFISFNINGLRAHIHQLQKIIKKFNPDIIGLQETKINDESFPKKKILSYGYNSIYYGQKSKYGVALLSKKKPININYGLHKIKNLNEDQKRIVIAKFLINKKIITIINAYFPQGENINHPIKFKLKENFYNSLYKYINTNFFKKSYVIIMGDMNISPTDLDIGIGKINYKKWIKLGKCSFLKKERILINRLLKWGFVDTYRYINPNLFNKYSWFDYRSNSFIKNKGLRIDLILASLPLINKIFNSGIDYDIRSMEKPSDHAPVWTNFKF